MQRIIGDWKYFSTGSRSIEFGIFSHRLQCNASPLEKKLVCSHNSTKNPQFVQTIYANLSFLLDTLKISVSQIICSLLLYSNKKRSAQQSATGCNKCLFMLLAMHCMITVCPNCSSLFQNIVLKCKFCLKAANMF